MVIKRFIGSVYLHTVCNLPNHLLLVMVFKVELKARTRKQAYIDLKYVSSLTRALSCKLLC